MRKANDFLIWLVCAVASTSHAQPHGNTTLNQAIEAAKTRKLQELNQSASAMGTVSLPPLTSPAAMPVEAPKTKPIKKTMPQLWSIQGLDHILSAEIAYEGKIYTVSLTPNFQRVGNWVLVGLNAQEAELTYLESGDKSTYATSEVIRLRMPNNSMAAAEVFVTSPSAIPANTGAPLPTDITPPDFIANAKSSMKLPSALNLLKP